MIFDRAELPPSVWGAVELIKLSGEPSSCLALSRCRRANRTFWGAVELPRTFWGGALGSSANSRLRFGRAMSNGISNGISHAPIFFGHAISLPSLWDAVELIELSGVPPSCLALSRCRRANRTFWGGALGSSANSRLRFGHAMSNGISNAISHL
jgi:hypothetical protein